MCQIILQMLSQLYKFLFNSSKNNIEKEGADEVDDRINEMEAKIAALEDENKNLQQQLDYNRNREADLQRVLHNYDNLLKKVIMEKNITEGDDTTRHLANLQSAFYDLLQKYEKAKQVVYKYQQNESALRKQVEEYEIILDGLKSKFTKYKCTSEKKETTKKQHDLKNKSIDSTREKKRRFLTTM